MGRQFEIGGGKLKGGRGLKPLEEVNRDALNETEGERYERRRANGLMRVIAGLSVAAVVTSIAWAMTP